MIANKEYKGMSSDFAVGLWDYGLEEAVDYDSNSSIATLGNQRRQHVESKPTYKSNKWTHVYSLYWGGASNLSFPFWSLAVSHCMRRLRIFEGCLSFFLGGMFGRVLIQVWQGRWDENTFTDSNFPHFRFFKERSSFGYPIHSTSSPNDAPTIPPNSPNSKTWSGNVHRPNVAAKAKDSEVCAKSKTRWKPRTRMYSRSWTTSANLCNRKTNLFLHASCAHTVSAKAPEQQFTKRQLTSTTTSLPAQGNHNQHNITSAMRPQRNHPNNKIISATKSQAQQHHQRNEITSTTNAPAERNHQRTAPAQQNHQSKRNHY